MIDRRAFASGIALAVLGLPPTVAAQQASRVYRIGVLASSVDPVIPYVERLRDGLRERGYVDGQNLRIEWRSSGHVAERYPGLAAELVRLNVDLIVTLGTPAALAAKRATTTIPIVITSIADPVGAGVVQSLARPGANITGVSGADFPQTIQKLLQLLKEVLPAVSRVAVWIDQSNSAQVDALRQLGGEVKALSVMLHRTEIRTEADLDTGFNAAVRDKVDALLVFPMPMKTTDIRKLTKWALEHRLPVVSNLALYVQLGCLVSYGPDRAEQWYHASAYIDKILKGAKPQDLPVEQPTKFELVVNRKTANALGLTIPPSLLLQATQVIE